MNHVTLIGRLTKDPISRTTTTGKATSSFTLAVNRTKTETDFINCVAWEKTSEIVQQYARKGSQIAVEGRINTRNYDGTDGKKVYVTEVVANNVHLLDKFENKPQEARIDTGEVKFDTGKILDINSDDLPF